MSTPAVNLESAVELAVEIEDRESAFTDIDVEITALDVGGDQACAEWIARFTHSGPLEVNDDAIEPTGSTRDDARRDGRGLRGRQDLCVPPVLG